MTRRSITKRVAIVTATATATAVVAVGTVAAGAAVAGPSWGESKQPTKKQVLGLFDQWNAALQTGDPEEVAELYAKDAVLLPTVSNNVRSDKAEIVDYFEHFLKNKPVGTKIESHVNVLDSNSVIDAGTYEFALTDPKTGQKSTVKARYTYAYEKQNGEWLIVNHHSSKMPEG